MNQEILIDTGPIVAILSQSDTHHAVCSNTLQHLRPPLLTTWPVLTEAQWLLRRSGKATEALFIGLQKNLWKVIDLDEEALTSIPRFLRKYHDFGAQLADASLIYLADKKKITTIFTLDRKDFGVYRLRNRQKITVIP